MKLPNPFRRPQTDTSAAARQMALQGVAHRRAKIRARVDQMRADMGMAPARWPQ